MERKPDPVKFCKACHVQLFRRRFENRLEDLSEFRKRIYCNRKCMGKGHEKPSPTRSALLKRARKMRLSVCQECGSTKNIGTHHKDENWRNNSPENLATLCASCHLKWHWKNGKRMPKRQSVCIICGSVARKLDMCQKHYQRLKKYGDPCLTKIKDGQRFTLIRVAPDQ